MEIVICEYMLNDILSSLSCFHSFLFTSFLRYEHLASLLSQMLEKRPNDALSMNILIV
jgi:hypothetical protein